MKHYIQLLRIASLYGLSILLCGILTACSNVYAKEEVKKPKVVQNGHASWYSVQTNNGTKTASGKKLHDHKLTAAHKYLPFGTRVKVTNLKNGKSEVVTIIDRGPYVRGRIIDVTIGTAQRLGFMRSGVTPVKIEVLTSKKQ